jgi:hypothetical protein
LVYYPSLCLVGGTLVHSMLELPVYMCTFRAAIGTSEQTVYVRAGSMRLLSVLREVCAWLMRAALAMECKLAPAKYASSTMPSCGCSFAWRAFSLGFLTANERIVRCLPVG